MRDQELAHRIVGYADAVVAVDFLSVTAFGLAVADPDISCSLAQGNNSVLIINAVVAVVFSLCLYFLRRWELDLGAEDSLSEKGQKYARHLNVARYCVVWISLLIVNSVVLMIDNANCAA